MTVFPPPRFKATVELTEKELESVTGGGIIVGGQNYWCPPY